MAPLKVIPILEEMCVQIIVDWLCYAVDNIYDVDLSEEVYETPNDLISCITSSSVYQLQLPREMKQLSTELLARLTAVGAEQLMEAVQMLPSLPSRVRVGALAVLANGRIGRRLAPGPLPARYHALTLSIIATSGHTLEQLDLRGIWLQTEAVATLCRLLPHLRYLQQLLVPYVANQQLLKSLANICPHLKLLDISMTSQLSSESVIAMLQGSCHRELTIVRLGTPGGRATLDSAVGAMFIKQIPTLRSLGPYEYSGYCLIDVCTEDPEFTCQLTQLHFFEIDGERLSKCLRSCPHLQKLYLNCPKGNCLEVVSNTALKSLKLRHGVSNELLDALELLGNDLEHLQLLQMDGILDLVQVARTTPHMQSLHVIQTELAPIIGPRRHLWPHLTEAVIQFTTLPPKSLELLLNAPELRILVVDDSSFLTDDQLAEILRGRTKLKLEHAWFGWAPLLSITGVRCLLNNCPSLQRLGSAEGMAIEPETWQQLDSEMALINWDIVFI